MEITMMAMGKNMGISMKRNPRMERSRKMAIKTVKSRMVPAATARRREQILQILQKVKAMTIKRKRLPRIRLITQGANQRTRYLIISLQVMQRH
jgi:hypothetical protein